MIDHIISELNNKLGLMIKSLFKKNDRRLYIDISKEDIVKASRILYGDFKARFSIMTGIDTFKGIELLYHFSLDHQGGVFVTLRVLLEDKKKPEIESLTSVFLASNWIEREVHELLGVNFINHPNLEHLLLTNDWPEGVYPLRKEYVSEKGLPENE
ncbi:MAG: NADH-quinone oxidoreductase subunit C [bacterium]